VRKHGLGDSGDSFVFWRRGATEEEEDGEEEEEEPIGHPAGERSERDAEEMAKALHAEYLEAMLRFVAASLVSLYFAGLVRHSDRRSLLGLALFMFYSGCSAGVAPLGPGFKGVDVTTPS
jgi:hypothetical protein